MHALATLVSPVKARLMRAGVYSTVASLLWIVQSAAIAVGFASLLSEQSSNATVIYCALCFALTGLIRAMLDNSASKLAFEAADDLIGVQRRSLLEVESMRSTQSVHQPGAAQTASLIAEKIATLHPYLLRYWPARVRVMVVPLVLLVVIFPVSWVVGLLLLMAGPLIPLFMALVGYAAKQASEDQLKEMGTLNSLLIDQLSAMVDIRLLDASERAIDQFKTSADSLRRRTMNVLKIAFLSSTVLELFSAIGVAMVAVYTGFALLGEITFGAYRTPLTVTEGIFILLLAPEFFQPLRDLASAWHDKAAAEAVADELAAQQPADQILGSGGRALRLAGPLHLETKGLSFESPAGRLRFPDLKLKAGDTLALTGASGAGKSTLLSLIAGLSQPTGGQVLVAGECLTSANADSWRASIGWVSQAPHFLNASLRANIALSGDLHNDAALKSALSIASATDVIQKLPAGLQTRLGETGTGVSGGEARRLTIARAAFSAPDIILADEPTADLDDQTAQQVTESLIAFAAQGAMVVVATHDQVLAGRMQQQLELQQPLVSVS